jgi:acetyltransferase-like isoleucine patch superfamily enzyme
MSQSSKKDSDARSAAPSLEENKAKRDYLDPKSSARGGLGGLLETMLRRFKNAVHFILIMPIYVFGCSMLGLAIAPGVMVFQLVSGWGAGTPYVIQCFLYGFAIALGYFTYGFSMIFVVPLINLVLGLKLKPWRGPYYSLEAIRWYVHNGATYLLRYTFLEFATPTPFSHLFYRLMGMKIGRGTVINTTAISDPSLIEMGEKVTIGGSVSIIGHYGQGGYLVLAPVKIGNKATVGLRAIIMGGVTIGDEAKILPNSVVMPKTTIPAGETWGGVPAVKIGGPSAPPAGVV